MPAPSRGFHRIGFAVALFGPLALAACGDARPAVSRAPAGCSACHGSALNPAPPTALNGSSDTLHVGVGAHQMHLRDTVIRQAVACGECHVVPGAVADPGHIDQQTATVSWGTLAAKGTSPGWERIAGTCSGVYCHGATVSGGTSKTPAWTFAVEPDLSRAGVCGTCHGFPPPAPHTISTTCQDCHPGTVLATGAIDVAGGLHVDGTVERQLPAACDACHGSALNPAPPTALNGSSDTLHVGVGAHQMHLRDTVIRQAVACGECHVVPATVADPGHIDQATATVTWGTLAAKGTSPSWDRIVETCSGVYCHGATRSGGTSKTPAWTFAVEPDLSRAGVCGTCHGFPPPAPHATSTTCHDCHPGTVLATGDIDVAGGLHVDGTLESQFPVACSACHGSALNPAPPTALNGSSDTLHVGVGAHQMHLRDTVIRQAVACGECHVVPATVNAPGHIDATTATVSWGTLAAKGTSPGWDRVAETCSGVYCHGATVTGGASRTPAWTFAVEPDLSRAGVCGTCHGFPPPAPHTTSTTCNDCHPGTVLATGDIDVAGGLHVDGAVQSVIGGTCGTCHDAPPATGAHLAHYGESSLPPRTTYGDTRILQDYLPGGASYYLFGCGNCHPLDPAKHGRGTVDIELYDAAAPAGSLKARNPPAAAYAKAPGDTYGSCASAYCHSSGQAAPGFYRTTPRWDLHFDPAVKDGCNGCHDNPPRYPSGGAGSATANTHLVLSTGLSVPPLETGHFAGLPGPSHDRSQHGGPGITWAGQDSAPITCQTCHYDTVDPANTGPSGFYYLDTAGSYQLPGGALGYACTSCHVAGDPVKPTGTGRALPLRHVNGRREVAFDVRATLPSIAWLPAAPNTPTKPYWATRWGLDPLKTPVPPLEGSTWSFGLAGATYDPVTKGCSAVACHVSETQPRWGVAPVGISTCGNCHPR